MPLNMNTVGTGTGIGGGSGGDLVIRNTSQESSKLISSVYYRQVSSMAYSDNYSANSSHKTLTTNSLQLERWGSGAVYYNGYMYLLYQYNSSYTFNLYRYAYNQTSNGNTLTSTILNPPFTSNYSTRMIQLGNYLYFYNSYSSSNVVFLYRFDGSTFTKIASDSMFKYFFNQSVTISDGYQYMEIIPMTSDKYSGLCCTIDTYYISSTTWGDDRHPNGFSGIFTIDSSGFHLKESYTINGYYDSESAYIPHAYAKSCMVSDWMFVSAEVASSNMVVNKYTMKYAINNDNKSYYRSFTQVYTKNIVAAPSTYSWCRFNRLSYPQYDSFILTISPKDYYDQNIYTNCKWYFAKIINKDIEYKSISITGSLMATSGLAALTFVTDRKNPYVCQVYNSSDYAYIAANDTTVSGTYDSNAARFELIIELSKGDIIRCDDSIISYCKSGGTAVTVNATTCKIPSDGKYTVLTKTYDAYTIPSVLVTDSNGNIAYIHTEAQSNGSIVGYFLNGMTVNGTKVTSSRKATYGPSNRYLISAK